MRIPEKYVLASFLLWATSSLSAQTTPPNPNPPPPGLPIDGYLWIGTLVALALGIHVFAKKERLKRSHDVSTRNERRGNLIKENYNNPK